MIVRKQNIYAGNEPVAVYIQNDSNTMYTLHTNHLGSIEKISDKNGNVVDSMSYTPFGQRRSVTDWTRNDTATRFTDRGFTGQQHLDNFALINFNGRMYDPVLAHFLSPDPYIQNPENPLNYNRYSYCLFSPLQYVDPSGEKIDWVEGIDGKIYWDPLATSLATTKNGEKYWGKEGFGIDEETGLLVHYKSDGTKSNFIISKKGTIVAEEKISKGFNWGIPWDFTFLSSWFEKLGGIFGVAKNGQGQETRIGTGPMVDLSPFTDNIPSPFVNNYKPTNITPPITNKPQKVQNGYLFEYNLSSLSGAHNNRTNRWSKIEDSAKTHQDLINKGCYNIVVEKSYQK